MKEKNESNQKTDRRAFIGTLASGAAALGVTTLAAPLKLKAEPAQATEPVHEADVWFNKLKGKHKIVYDVTQPHEVFPFAWSRVFLMTNATTGTPESECGVVVVLRHAGIGYAFEDRLWEKYKFADMFKAREIGPAFQAADAATALDNRNPFWNPKPGDFKLPGIGPVAIGINELQASGVMFCVCSAAITVFTSIAAMQMKLQPAEVMADWMKGLLPNIQMVPSGVWAVGRAQEKGCGYCFAG